MGVNAAHSKNEIRGMALWAFRCYLSPDGTDEIRAAYDAKQRQARQKFGSRLRILSELPFEEWHSALYKDLHGPAVGIGEIRFEADKLQQRVLGFRSGDGEFSLVFWAIEKGNKFVPLSAPATALARKSAVISGKDTTNALWLALE